MADRQGGDGGVDQAPSQRGICPVWFWPSESIAPSQWRPVRDSPVGAVILVWLPEQADSCDYTARFGAGF